MQRDYKEGERCAMDLISRQALKSSLTNWQMEYAEKSKDAERFETLGAVIELVEKLPTIDPVKHGKWIERERYRTTKDGVFHTYRYKVCSICGRASGRRMNKRTRYCPNCGARMRGE